MDSSVASLSFRSFFFESPDEASLAAIVAPHPHLPQLTDFFPRRLADGFSQSNPLRVGFEGGNLVFQGSGEARVFVFQGGRRCGSRFRGTQRAC